MIVPPPEGGPIAFAAPIATQSHAGLSANSIEESTSLLDSHEDPAETVTGVEVVIVSSVPTPSELSLDTGPGNSDDDLVRAFDAVLEEGPPIIG